MPAGWAGRSVVLTPGPLDCRGFVESADQKEILVKSLRYSQDSMMGLFRNRKRQLKHLRTA